MKLKKKIISITICLIISLGMGNISYGENNIEKINYEEIKVNNDNRLENLIAENLEKDINEEKLEKENKENNKKEDKNEISIFKKTLVGGLLVLILGGLYAFLMNKNGSSSL